MGLSSGDAPGQARGPGPSALTDDPLLAPLLPMVYVAWADGVLTAEELDAIRERVGRLFSWLPEETRNALLAWLRPESPPTPAQLEILKEHVRKSAAECPEETRRSLADLGLGLADLDPELAGPWGAAEARAALDQLEASLGVVGREATRSLLRAPAPMAVHRKTPLFDVGVLGAFLKEPNAELRREVMALLATPPLRIRPRPGLSAYRERVLTAVTLLADRGYGLLALPESVGGRDDPASAIAVFETLAFGDLSVMVKFGVQFGLFGGSVLHLGTERHHRRYLEDIGRLRLPGCFAMTEVGHGSNVRGIRTRATYDPEADGFVVHTPDADAKKDWIGNAATHGRMASVFAQLEVGGHEHGVHVLLVPIRDPGGEPLPGVTIEDRGEKVGLNGVDNGVLSFDHVRVPRENLLDRYASVTEAGDYESPIPSAGRRFFTMVGSLVAGRISVAAASVSVAKTALTTAIRYSERRRQFGPAGQGEVPILDYLVHQRALLPRLAATYGLHFAVRDLVARYAEGVAEDSRRVEALAAGLKAVASRHAMDTVQASREACGGEGYAAANRFGELRADADIFTTFEGANPVLLQLVARALLGRYKEEMGDLKVWDLVKYLADRGQVRVAEMNPIVTRNTDEAHLRSTEFLTSALEYREERLLSSVARRLKARIDEGLDSFDAMNACQDHLVTLARAHVDRVVLERFLEGVARAPTPGLSEVLRALAELYGLSRLEEASGWYLEAGYMEPAKSRAVRTLVSRICGEVREEAVFLVDAFGIDAAVLDTPAGGDAE